MKLSTHIIFWFGCILVLSLLVPSIMGPKASYARILAEHDSAEAVFGTESTNRMTDMANKAHDLLIKQTGIQGLIDGGFTSYEYLQQQRLAADTQLSMGTTFNKYLQTLSTEFYGLVFRGCIMLHWLMYLSPFLIAAFADGIAQRRVKLATVKSLSPLRFTLSMHFLVIAGVSPVIYLLAPFEVTPWFMVFWALIVAYPLTKAISNIVGLD